MVLIMIEFPVIEHQHTITSRSMQLRTQLMDMEKTVAKRSENCDPRLTSGTYILVSGNSIGLTFLNPRFYGR